MSPIYFCRLKNKPFFSLDVVLEKARFIKKRNMNSKVDRRECMEKYILFLSILLTSILMMGCTTIEEESVATEETNTQETTQVEVESQDVAATETTESDETEEVETTVAEETKVVEEPKQATQELFAGYELIEVDGGDLSGSREPNAVVDIGYGDREYWSFTNEYGQLVRVVATEIILQDDERESVLSSGRYYSDEAKVPGVENDTLDEGHVIADSLGGVSNAYNITPQDSTLNRHGDQAYMEDVIRKAGGATNFEATISYPNTKTHIPSSYQYAYTVRGNEVVDKFDNVNPDEVNESLGLTDSAPVKSPNKNTNGDVANVDTNGNGQVTIKEAKAAGFSMPIMSDHWLYPYMRDNDNDGMVGE